MPITTFMSSVLGWLRAGYPDGTPRPTTFP